MDRIVTLREIYEALPQYYYDKQIIHKPIIYEIFLSSIDMLDRILFYKLGSNEKIYCCFKDELLLINKEEKWLKNLMK